MPDIVERYLNAIASHHWDVVDECIAADIVRVGPYGDRYAGRDEYLAFIADLMPRLEGYEMKLERVTYASDALAFVELIDDVAHSFAKACVAGRGKHERTSREIVAE